MADVRILPLLYRLYHRRFMDGLQPHRGQLQCVPFCSCTLLPTQAAFISETLPNYALYRHRLAKGWLPGSDVVSLASWVSVLPPRAPAPYSRYCLSKHVVAMVHRMLFISFLSSVVPETSV